MMKTLEELDGFIWNNSLENDYNILGSKGQRSWLCEAEPDAINTICETFEELEFIEFSENVDSLPQELSKSNEETS